MEKIINIPPFSIECKIVKFVAFYQVLITIVLCLLYFLCLLCYVMLCYVMLCYVNAEWRNYVTYRAPDGSWKCFSNDHEFDLHDQILKYYAFYWQSLNGTLFAFEALMMFFQVLIVTRLGMDSPAGQPLRPIPQPSRRVQTCLVSKTVRADSIVV